MALEEKDTGIFSLSMIQQVIEYIENNLLEKLTPAAVASHFFVSESVLFSLFKIVCNMTIMEYIRNRRLTLAAEELVESNIPIIELAYKYGYEVFPSDGDRSCCPGRLGDDRADKSKCCKTRPKVPCGLYYPYHR